MKQKAIIIGSGIGGLATAIRLAGQDFDVSVFEKNSTPGGKSGELISDGFHFDTGPSLFTKPGELEALFNYAGVSSEKYIKYERTDIACKYFFENGTVINAFNQTERFTEELREKAGEDPAAVKKYLGRSDKLYNNIGSVFLDHSLHKAKTWFHPRIVKALRSVRLPVLFKTLAAYNKKSFRSPEARQIFDRFATYNGSSPYKAPAMLSLIPHLEHNEGVYYPSGGMISISDSLFKLAKHKGVEFHFNQPVEKIICNGNKASGVVVNGGNIFCDIVVSNGDIYFTRKNLLGDERKSEKLIKQERSSSAIVFYWGINKTFPELDLHNIFFSNNYKEEFENIFKLHACCDDPTVYINITSKMEAGKAPLGKENWFVMVNVPALTSYSEETMIADVKNKIIAKLNRMLKCDLASLIIFEKVLHPKIIQSETASYKGSLYGAASNSRMSAFLRSPNFSRNTKDLYFCGGSVHPGGGIPLCLKSAKIVGELVAAKTKTKAHA